MVKAILRVTSVLVVLVGCRDGPTIPAAVLPDTPPQPSLDGLAVFREFVGDPLVVDLIEGIEDRTAADALQKAFRELAFSLTIRDPDRLSELLAVLRSHPLWSTDGEDHPNDQVALAALTLVLDDAALLLTMSGNREAEEDRSARSILP